MKETLCWGCNKCTGFCPWSQDFTPVDGWDATPTKIETEVPGEYIDSFLIHKCPLYEPDIVGSKRISRNALIDLIGVTKWDIDTNDDNTLANKARDKGFVLEIQRTDTGKRQFMIHKV